MKRLLLFIFVSAICAMAFPLKVTGDKSTICKILTKEHKCRVAVQDISKKYNETINTWGYRQGYTQTPLVAKRCCICIHYYVDKDTGGSSYYRDLFIPIEYVTKELEKSDEVYYMDRWAGKGPRFDSQGGTFTVNNTVRQIIKLIKLQK